MTLPPAAAEFSWSAWHWHPSVIAGLALMSILYAAGVGPLRHRFAWAEGVGRWRIGGFVAGVVVLWVALLSPLHELGDQYLLSAHMVQHLLLTLVAPPLLLLASPGWLLRPALRSRSVLRAVRWITLPVVAFIVFNAVLVFWHVPFFYDLTLEERSVHITEHLMFVATAMVMWWPVLSPLPELPRASYLVQMAYLFLLPTLPSILGAVITFADDVIYSWYATAPRVWGISPHTDQQLGGIIMWIPGGLVFLCTLIVVFLIWATEDERQSRLPQSAPRERSGSI